MKSRFRTILCQIALAGIALSVILMGGCEVDSFLDPSKVGYFEQTATTTPILERLDVVERGEDDWDDAEAPTADDLIPIELEYRLAAGDIITVGIYELRQEGSESFLERQVDQSGNIRLPLVDDVPAAGLTLGELEAAISEALDPEYIRNPQVHVTLNDGRGFMYSIEGNVAGPGVYFLTRPDLRLTEALAIAGGIPINTETIYVIRRVSLVDEMDPFSNRRRPPTTPPDQDQNQNGEPPVDIDELIDDLGGDNDNDAGAGGSGGGGLSRAPLDSNERAALVDDDEPVWLGSDVPIDIDDLNGNDEQGLRPASPDNSWIYVSQTDEWVRILPGQIGSPQQDDEGLVDVDELQRPTGQPLILERVIEIDPDRLVSDSSLNIIVRPDDRIYLERPPSGVVYIDGEILRRGVFNMPALGRLTLTQLVTAAGGFGPLAVPERVDLTRRLSGNRQATLRVNLRAIFNRTEPDIYLKPDDHVLVGTSFVAAPLAVIRNGFRATYGFGFLLDRNFGNDVFGPPPVNRGF